MRVATEYVIEPMQLEHIAAVQVIERQAFPQPWPQNAYRRELQENRMARYVVARDRTEAGISEQSGNPLPESQPESLLDRIARFLRNGPELARTPVQDAHLQTVVGYAGMWMMADEAHITTIASHQRVRGKGVGELLLLAMIHTALEMHARWVTLEVRASNSVAQNLYRKYTFKEMGVRRRYYSDNGEDALVMWTDALDSPTFLEAYQRNERLLGQKMGAEIRSGENPRVLGDD